MVRKTNKKHYWAGLEKLPLKKKNIYIYIYILLGTKFPIYSCCSNYSCSTDTNLWENKKNNRRDVFRTVQLFYTIIMPQTKSLTKEILLSCNQNSFVTSVNKQCSPKVCFGEVFHIKCIIIKWSHMQITSCWKHFTFRKKKRDMKERWNNVILFFYLSVCFILFFFS